MGHKATCGSSIALSPIERLDQTHCSMEPKFIVAIEKLPCLSILNAELDKLPPGQDAIRVRLEHRIADIMEQLTAAGEDQKYLKRITALDTYLKKKLQNQFDGEEQAAQWLPLIANEISAFRQHQQQAPAPAPAPASALANAT